MLDGNGSSSPAVELERARIKIRKLEKEVSIIMYSVYYVCSWYFWSDKFLVNNKIFIDWLILIYVVMCHSVSKGK